MRCPETCPKCGSQCLGNIKKHEEAAEKGMLVLHQDTHGHPWILIRGDMEHKYSNSTTPGEHYDSLDEAINATEWTGWPVNIVEHRVIGGGVEAAAVREWIKTSYMSGFTELPLFN